MKQNIPPASLMKKIFNKLKKHKYVFSPVVIMPGSIPCATCNKPSFIYLYKEDLVCIDCQHSLSLKAIFS